MTIKTTKYLVCDCCGTTVDVSDFKPDDSITSKTNWFRLFINAISFNESNIPGDQRNKKDLCDKCLDSFDIWLSNRKRMFLTNAFEYKLGEYSLPSISTCPSCGGESILETTPTGTDPENGLQGGINESFVICENCGLQSAKVGHLSTQPGPQVEAITRWNKRV